MHNVSQAFNNKINEPSRTFKARLTIGGAVVTDGITKLIYSGISNAEDDFSIGSVPSAGIEVTVSNPALRARFSSARENLLVDSDEAGVAKKNANYDRYFANSHMSEYCETSITSISESPCGTENKAIIHFKKEYNGSLTRALTWFSDGYVPIEVGKTYTMSAWFKTSDIRIKPMLEYGDEQFVVDTKTLPTTTDWIPISFTFEAERKYMNRAVNGSRFFFGALCPGGVTGTVEVTGFKLEEGAFSTPWIHAVADKHSSSIAKVLVDVEDKEIFCEIGLDINGTYEYIPLGYFTADKPDRDEITVSFNAYDRIMKTEVPFTQGSVPSNTNTNAVLDRIAAICNVTIDRSGLTSFSMARPDGYTCREVLGYIAQMYGGFCVCGRDGKIYIKRFGSSVLSVDADRYFSFKHADFTSKVERLKCFTGKDEDGNDVSVTAGTGPSEVSFSNPFMSQADVDRAFNYIKNYTYMSGNVRFLGDPRIDVWDTITVTDIDGSYAIPCMSVKHEYDGGLTTEIEAFGQTGSQKESSYKSPSTAYKDRVSGQLAVFDTMIADTVKTSYLEANYAKITDLRASEIHADNIYAKKAEVGELVADRIEANEAAIGNLQAGTASIAHLLAGNASITDLVNLNLVSQNLSGANAIFGDILAGSAAFYSLVTKVIKTNEITIQSDDGRFRIDGNTLQIKDANDRTRIQMGKDARGNFTFTLYDENGTGILLDSTGIKESAIGDGLIVDKMVSDEANISAEKLNIDSLFSAMNQDGKNTIKSTKVFLDDYAQSLSVLFKKIITTADANKDGKSLSEQISDNNGVLSEHSTSITAAQGKLNILMSDAEFKNYGTGKQTVASRMSSMEQTVGGFTSRVSSIETEFYGDGSQKGIKDSFTQLSQDMNQVSINASAAISQVDSTVASATVMYYLSTSRTSLSGGSWSSTAPTATAGKYIWTKTVFTKKDESTTESNAVCISGTDGQSVKGDPGIGIVKIQELYYVTSRSYAPNKLNDSRTPITLNNANTYNAWNLTCPVPNSTNKYIYTCTQILYTDDVYRYSDPASSGFANVISSSFDVKSDGIYAKVQSGVIESIVEQKADSIRLKADKIAWTSTNSSMTEEGHLVAKNMELQGTTKLGGEAVEPNSPGSYYDPDLGQYVELELTDEWLAENEVFWNAISNETSRDPSVTTQGMSLGYNGLVAQNGYKRGVISNDRLIVGKAFSSKAVPFGMKGSFFVNPLAKGSTYSNDAISIFYSNTDGNEAFSVKSTGDAYFRGAITERLQTNNFDETAYCYATVGGRFVGAFGEDRVYTNGSVYSSTVYVPEALKKYTSSADYHVTLTAYGNGTLYVYNRRAAYFTVRATCSESIAFGWEIKVNVPLN